MIGVHPFTKDNKLCQFGIQCHSCCQSRFIQLLFPPLHRGTQRCTHSPPVTVSHVARMSTNYEQVASARAHRSRDHVMHLINVWQSKLRLAPPLWFHAINTISNFSYRNSKNANICIWFIKHILAGSIIYKCLF